MTSKKAGGANASALFDEGNFIDGRAVTAAEYAAHTAANNHLRVYARTRKGLLVWRAYTEYRERGVPVPEHILAKFDNYAAALERASSVADFSKALELSRSNRAAVGVVLHNREIVEAIFLLMTKRGSPLKQKPACAAVAKRFGMTAGAVEQVFDRWKKGHAGALKAKQPAEREWTGPRRIIRKLR